MKKLLYVSLVMLFLGTSYAVAGDPQVQNLKAQKRVLKLNTELTNLRMAYEKALAASSGLQTKAAEANADANSTIVTSYSTADASGTAQTAKDQAKTLDKVEKANDKLAKNQKELDRLKKKIEKVQSQLDKLNKKIEFVNQ